MSLNVVEATLTACQGVPLKIRAHGHRRDDLRRVAWNLGARYHPASRRHHLPSGHRHRPAAHEMTPTDATIVPCPSCGTKNRVRAIPSGVPRCSVCHAMLPWIVNVSPEHFDAELRASVPVLVDFWAPWCGPCRMVSPLVEQLGREYAGRLKVVKLNVDEAPAISARYGVQGIPLLIVFRGGEVDRLVGAAPYERLKAWIEPHLRSVAAGQ